jgi:catechol 2,3-dioxygenase-like lactoylglutathione lyase family enzyme
MLDHLSFQVAGVPASAAFYDTVLAPLGGTRIIDFGEAIGYGVPPMPDFWIGGRSSGEGFRESHIAFTADDRATVRAFFEAAVASGAEVLHEPRLRPAVGGPVPGRCGRRWAGWSLACSPATPWRR